MRAILTTALLAFSATTTIALADTPVTYPPSAYKDGAVKCMQSQSWVCAEKNWTQYLKMRPNDSKAMANLAIVYNWDDKPEPAIVQAEKSIGLGEGTYDLFAAYAESLEKVGRNDEAIDWSYKTLQILPSLVNVRGDLAKLLLGKKREYEALALLSSFDASTDAQGYGRYFEGQRIAIESSIDRQGATAAAAQKNIRLPKNGDHFYAPVKVGDANFEAFVVDTGASKTSMSEELLAASKAPYKVVQASVSAQLADGRKTTGRMVTLDTLKVGPFDMHKVTIFVCRSCAPLLGQGSLSQFNMVSSKTQGVEFMTLELRAANR